MMHQLNNKRRISQKEAPKAANVFHDTEGDSSNYFCFLTRFIVICIKILITSTLCPPSSLLLRHGLLSPVSGASGGVAGTRQVAGRAAIVRRATQR